jgi:predicted TIM-barrel fold metal-dependent hydrolase
MGRIDAHVHGDSEQWPGDPAAYVDACRARGIDAVVLIEPLERCLRAVERFGEFIIPVARIEMDQATPDEVQRCIDAGCPGIKFIRPKAPYGDPHYWPLYERLETLGRTAVFHTGYLGFHARELEPVRFQDMRAAQIDVVARRFPELRILMAHYSNPWWEEAWKVSWSNRNVYADLSGGTAIRRSLAMWADLFAPDGRLQADTIAKLCFASDVVYFRPDAHPFVPYIDFYERLFDHIGLPDALREQVNRGNAARLFGLSKGG